MNPHTRLGLLGASILALGTATALFGASLSPREWFLVAAGCVVAAMGLVILATLATSRRTTASTPTPSPRATPGALFLSYVQPARRSRKARISAILLVLWLGYTLVGLVASVVRQQWVFALLYGTLVAVIPVLAAIRLSRPE
jgi:hypothetical protein